MTTSLLDVLLVVLLSLNFLLLGTSRIRAMINMVAVQGLLLGVVPLLAEPHLDLRAVLISLVTVGVKGVIIPQMLLRAMRDLRLHREGGPLVSLGKSLLLGAAGTASALIFAQYLPIAPEHASGLVVPASLATVATGFLVLITRTKSITQVLGYLVLENGIFLFGIPLLGAVPFLVEVGVLLDLFVGVFLMGMIIGRIDQEFAAGED
jgi:hydrogenase-4 component E